ncbi:MAG: amylo-alpha-1,6-glucosidase [Syntrophales bacterium]|jgi:glycogen debranching enzyme|nr:amylo-alpha-1,6-glucosidase [Syntrophales bacterium]MCK9392498.1 amylo-alpha-1,6-glucosidase [Syntrophales bacterium]
MGGILEISHLDIGPVTSGGEESNLPLALQREWLDVNGRGGYASSTLLNCHTRKYHGLLVARLATPPGRYVLLSKFEDIFSCGARQYPLTCHQYPHNFFPEDYRFLKTFQQDVYPEFIYEGDGIRIRKSLMMAAEEDCLLVRYDLDDCPARGVLRLRPFLAFRDHHRLTRENPFLRAKITTVKNGFSIRPYAGMPPLVIQTNIKPDWQEQPFWYHAFEYAEEAVRGYEHHEDLYSPGILEITLRRGKTVIVSVSLAPFYGRLSKKWDDEERRRRKLVQQDGVTAGTLGMAVPELPAQDHHGEGAAISGGEGVATTISPDEGEDQRLLRLLLRAGRQFIVRNPEDRPAIIAGYPWFGEWGRDTLISLPGLTFCCGRIREGTDILTHLAKFERQGLLPNVFSEEDKIHAYNTVDAPLWYFWAVQQLLKYTGNNEAVLEKDIWPTLKNILRQFLHGTTFNIYMDDNGLLHAGAEGRALTWMDACIDNRPVTPRCGYPVEINALWYNAVCFAAELAARFGDQEFYFQELIPSIRQSFQKTFWIEEGAYLGDVYHDGQLDRSIRPNQIFAVSLPHSPLETDQARQVVEKVRNELLTPVGLRTLSPRDYQYRGRYEGSSTARDEAYHQGTVWPWLLGHYGEACLKVTADREETNGTLRLYLRTFLRRHFLVAGIGCVSEIFDGDPPHRPTGCISQAWSVAELIRLYTLTQ